MKVIDQKHEVLRGSTPMAHIERIARVCYKSEDKIGDGTAIKLIRNLYTNGHMAMMEHYRFIIEVDNAVYKLFSAIETPYIKLTSYNRNLVSFSVRGLLEMVEYSNADCHGILVQALEVLRDNIISYLAHRYNCCELFGMLHMPGENTIKMKEIPNERGSMSAEEWEVHGWMSVLFTTNRGVTHELVRHRPCAFAQESTRYCNYGGQDMQFTTPLIEDINMYAMWTDMMNKIEQTYNKMTAGGIPPQIARGVLPTDVKADIVLTATVDEWLHIFELRSVGTTGHPHPQMKALITPLFGDMIAAWYIKQSKEDPHLKIGGDWLYE